jgi:hypothetical protein
MADEDLSALTGAVYKQQIAPKGTTQKKRVTFVGLQSAAHQMLDSLSRYEEVMTNILEKAVFLAPTTWMDLPGPSFTEPIMRQIRLLSPPYVGGPNWDKRREEICSEPGS